MALESSCVSFVTDERVTLWEDKETGTGVVQGLQLHGELTPLHDRTMAVNACFL